MSVPILLYHQIAPLPEGVKSNRGLWVYPEKFRKQMLTLKQLGYKGLSMRDAMPYLREGKKGKVFVITFDDGFVNVLENAAPVLAECGFTATNYFVSNQTGGSNIWDLPKGLPKTDCMSAQQIREWAALGHEVGAHTVDHVYLNSLDDQTSFRQIKDCKAALEDIVGSAVTNFCYPYGANQTRHREMVREAGYETATTTIRARARPSDDPYGIPRIYVRRSDPLPYFLLRYWFS